MTPELTAMRGVNAHPWLSATAPELGETDLVIVPPDPAPQDRPSGHVEGHMTWNHTSTGTVAYLVALGYEGPDGTVEEQITVRVDPLDPLAWTALAYNIAKLMHRVHTLAHLDEEGRGGHGA